MPFGQRLDIRIKRIDSRSPRERRSACRCLTVIDTIRITKPGNDDSHKREGRTDDQRLFTNHGALNVELF